MQYSERDVRNNLCILDGHSCCRGRRRGESGSEVVTVVQTAEPRHGNDLCAHLRVRNCVKSRGSCDTIGYLCSCCYDVLLSNTRSGYRFNCT